VTRVLEAGGREDLKWLLKRYPRRDIRRIIETQASRLLSARSRRLWSLVFGATPGSFPHGVGRIPGVEAAPEVASGRARCRRPCGGKAPRGGGGLLSRRRDRLGAAAGSPRFAGPRPFFREQRAGSAERQILHGALRASGDIKILEEKDGTCHLSLSGTAVSLFHYPYPMIGRLESWSGLRLASLEDLAAMKLSAVLGRGAKKDFLDLHELCRKLGLERVMRAGARKFTGHRDFPLQAARALVYFEDAEKEPMPKMLNSTEWGEVKAYFEAAIPKYVRTHLR